MKPMTIKQAEEYFGETGDDLLSSTCSFQCKKCFTSNYFPGNLEDAPEDFRCVNCGYTIFNRYRKPEHWENPMDAPLKWGSSVFPEEEWIDPKKKYTCGGKRVEYLRIVLHNSNGQEVTYPVKGTVILREKPRRVENRIWSLTGIGDLVWGGNEKDLVEVKGE